MIWLLFPPQIYGSSVVLICPYCLQLKHFISRSVSTYMAEMKESKCEVCVFAGRFGFTLSVLRRIETIGQAKEICKLKPGPLWFHIYSFLEFSVMKMGKEFEPDSLETGQFGKWIVKLRPIGSFSVESETQENTKWNQCRPYINRKEMHAQLYLRIIKGNQLFIKQASITGRNVTTDLILELSNSG
jgi:hypothetical protein